METGNFIRVALTMGYFFGAVVLMALIALLCYVVAGITRSPLTVVLAVAIQLAVIFVWNKVDLQIEKIKNERASADAEALSVIKNKEIRSRTRPECRAGCRQTS